MAARIEQLGSAMRKKVQGIYDNEDLLRQMIKSESNTIQKLIESRTNIIMNQILEMKKKLFTTHQQAAFHNREVERIIDRKGKEKYQPAPPALPRKTTTTPTMNIEGVVAQQAQEPEREAKSQSPHSSTEPGQPLLRE
jgi:hypothetical protein